MVKLYECGSCGCLHPHGFQGDCRDDANRLDGLEDYSERTGLAEFAADGTLQIEVLGIDEELSTVYTCAACGSCLEGGEGETCPLCGGVTDLEFQIEELNCAGTELDESGAGCAISRLSELATDGINERRVGYERERRYLGDAVNEMIASCDSSQAQVVAATAKLAEVLAAYRELVDGLDNMIGCNRLCEDDLPDDFEWLKEVLERICNLDPAKSN
jgi:hypothetical protein